MEIPSTILPWMSSLGPVATKFSFILACSALPGIPRRSSLCFLHDESRVRAVVFSSSTREWRIHPWVKVPAPVRSDDDNRWVQNAVGAMQANGFMYWVYEDQRYLVSLNTATMEFCVTELPHFLRDSSFHLGETKDGATCIVYSDQLNVGVLMPTRDDGMEKWVLDRVVPLDRELERVLRVGLANVTVPNQLVANHNDLSVLAVQDGYVYLVSTSSMDHDPETPGSYPYAWKR